MFVADGSEVSGQGYPVVGCSSPDCSSISAPDSVMFGSVAVSVDAAAVDAAAGSVVAFVSAGDVTAVAVGLAAAAVPPGVEQYSEYGRPHRPRDTSDIPAESLQRQ